MAACGREQTRTFPLWGLNTAQLAHQFIAAGFEATLICVDRRQLDPSFAGRGFDQRLLTDLPAAVDPCGENGEFHSFVHAGPILRTSISCTRGDIFDRDGFIFCDLAPTEGDVLIVGTNRRQRRTTHVL